MSHILALLILSVLLNLKSQTRFLKLLLRTEFSGYILYLTWLYIMSCYNYSLNKNSKVQYSVYNTEPLCKKWWETRKLCVWLACMCRKIAVKYKLEQRLAVSRNGFWAEQMTGLEVWLFTIYLFIGPLLWKTLFFSLSQWTPVPASYHVHLIFLMDWSENNG